MGKAGEQKVVAAVPKGFAYFRNILIPCCHGFEHEEIDLVAIGPTGIWSIEVKNWRGIAYPGDFFDEIVFVRNSTSGERVSTRENPYVQARDHAHDLHVYLARGIKTWFPTIHTLVVFVERDRNGVNGVNLYRIRRGNPSIAYLDELQERLVDPSHELNNWSNWSSITDLLEKLPTRRYN